MDYNELVNLAISYSDRGDKEVSDNIDNFIKIAEIKISRKLRTLEMSKAATMPGVEDQSVYPLPPDFNGFRDIQIEGKGGTFTYVNPEQMNNAIANKAGKNYYTIISNQLQISPPSKSSDVITIIYYQKIENLSPTNLNNWLSDEYPDVYLSALMIEISKFAKSIEGAQFWKEVFNEDISDMDLSDDMNRFSGTPLTIKVG